MVVIGVTYLVFEKKLLGESKFHGESTEPADSSLSRSLIGAQASLLLHNLQWSPNAEQIGFIVLALIVTRSSVLSIQAKTGLPRGNQIVGWIVLGI